MADDNCKEKILSEDYYDIIMNYLVPREGEATDYYCLKYVEERLGILYIPSKGLPPLSLNEYNYRLTPKLYALVQAGEEQYYRSLNASNILAVQNPPLDLKGRDCLLCFMDTGIDYMDDAFRFSDGTTKILSIWDQTIQEGEAPEGYSYGTQYSSEDINRALESDSPYTIVPSRDENGHGTMMAKLAIAAAPNAKIVMVKLKEAKQNLKDFYIIREGALAYSETDMLLAAKYLDSFAIEYRRPIVICIGLGTNMGDHSGHSVLDMYLNQIAEKRSRAVVIAAGNEGNARHHYYGDFVNQSKFSIPDLYGTGQGCNYYNEVEIKVGEGENGFITELWVGKPNIVTVSVRSPGGELLPRVPILNGSSDAYHFIYENTDVQVEYRLIEEGIGDELIFIRFVNPSPGIWTIGVYRNDNAGYSTENNMVWGTWIYHMWLPITGFISEDTYFLESNPTVTITEPSTAESPMGVATYNDLNNSLYINSGRGYTMNRQIKPDFVAPGVCVIIGGKVCAKER